MNQNLKIIRIFMLIVLFIFFMGLIVSPSLAQELQQERHILVLNSYNKGYAWTDNIVEGIESIFDTENSNYKISIEYMDTNIRHDEDYISLLHQLYKSKFQNTDIDIIIASDNVAYTFLKKYHGDLFPNIPIVVCGLNFYDNYIIQQNNFTGIVEELHFKDTIDIALALHPKASNFIVIFDNSRTGNMNTQAIKTLVPLYNNKIEFKFIQSDSFEEVAQKAKKLPKDSIIFAGAILQDKYGYPIPIEKGYKLISQAAHIPIYTAWDMSIGNGIIGGKVVSGYDQGVAVANMAKEVLEGRSISTIPFQRKSPNKYVFDYNELKRFNININDLPKDSRIINKPDLYLKIPKEQFYIALILIILLGIILYMLKKQDAKDSFNKEVMRAILHSTNDGLLIYDYEYNYVNTNEQFKKMWNISEDSLGQNSLFVIRKIIKDQVKNYNDIIDNINNIVTNSTYTSSVVELKSGKSYEWVFEPLIIDNGISGYLWRYKDITMKIDYEKKLAKSQKLYSKFIEILPDAVFIYKNTKVVIANESALNLLGHDTIEEMCEDPFENSIQIHPNYIDVVSKRMDQLSTIETTVDFMEEKYILQNGDVVDVEVGATSFKQNDDMYIVLVIRDIRERKKSEKLTRRIQEKNIQLKKAKEYDTLKTQFFSTISHELKTPLNVILGTVQLFQSMPQESNNTDTPHPLSGKYINMMKQNCYRLLRLINNLIDITRIDSNFLKMNIKNYNIVYIVEDITLSVAEYAKIYDVKLIFDTEIEEIIIACDADKIERIILNLLSNAVKFTPSGGLIEVNIMQEENNVIINIKDNGIGIPKDKLQDIFDRFKQVDSSTTRSKEGSGIGLSLVKALVELHSGTITVESELEMGSEFIIRLPIVQLPDTPTVYSEVATTRDEKVERISIEFSDIYS